MIPIKLQMINFGPYEDSTVNFDFTSTLITGENLNISGASNGTGKSTIFQAIAWALTGYSRYKNSSSIIRDGTDNTKVIFDFEVDGSSYRIIRGRNRTNKQTLDFYKVTAGSKLESVKADTNSKLDDKISEVTKIKYDSFLNTCYFAQNSISEFMYGTASTRQKLIAEILHLDRWNSYSETAKKTLSELETELDVIKLKLSSVRQLEDKKASLSDAISFARTESAKRADLLSIAEGRLSSVRSKIAEQKGSSALLATKKSLAEEIATIRQSIDKSELDIKQLGVELQNRMAAKPALPANPGPEVAEPIHIANKLSERKGELHILQKRLAALEAGYCDNCASKWDHHDHSGEIESIRLSITDLSARIKIGEAEYLSAQKSRKDWFAAHNSYTSTLNSISIIELSIQNIEKNISDKKMQLAAMQASLFKKESEISLLPEIIDADAGLQVEEAALKDRISTLQSEILSFEKRAAISEGELAGILSSIKETSDLSDKKAILEEQVGTYSSLVKHFGKTGIQANILDTVISEIEVLANNFMTKLNYKPFAIKFVTQKLDTKGQPKETLDIEVITPTSTKYIEDLSGGEQFRVAFSVRLALATVQARRQGGDINILLLDEVSSSLDKVGIETFVSIIRELEKTMKVMLITHDDSLKEHFDKVIHVVSDGKVAKVVQK